MRDYKTENVVKLIVQHTQTTNNTTSAVKVRDLPCNDSYIGSFSCYTIQTIRHVSENTHTHKHSKAHDNWHS